MADLRKIKAGLVKYEITEFVGEVGNIFFNVETGELRLSDGVTPGGLPIYAGGGGGGVNGGIFITSIVPVNPASNVQVVSTSSNGIVVDSILTTADLVTVTVLAVTGHTNYIPNVTINGVAVTLTAATDKPMHTGSVVIDLTGVSEIVAVHEDGAKQTVVVQADVIPIATAATFIGAYPGIQTELKAGDTFGFSVNSSIPIVAYEIENSGAFVFQSAAVVSTTTFTGVGTIANRGTVAQPFGFRVRVQTSTGAWSAWLSSTVAGSTNGTHTVVLNNQYPTITIGAIEYPAGQQALKNSESATVANTITSFDTVVYSSPVNELLVESSTYSPTKTVDRIGGSYNINSNNFRIVATRLANGSVSSANTVVKIANVVPTINISVPASRLRSGGNDGTSVQNYIVTLTSSQTLLSAPTMSGSGGTFSGTFSGSNMSWTKTLSVHDDDNKGVFNFFSLSAVGLSGLETSTIASGNTYTLGGFVSRTVVLPAFANELTINVAAVDYTKVSFAWSFKSSVVDRRALNSAPPVPDGWCLVALNTNPTIVRILDTSAAASSSQSSSVTIQEIV
jgi:hypothetical protein